MRFALLIYEGVEPIDLAPIGVLSMARRLVPEIETLTLARRAGEVLLSNGLRVVADQALVDAPPIDVLIVAGGPGWVQEARHPETLDFLKQRAPTTLIASICTGAMILAASGLLDGRRATTKREVVPPEEAPISVMRREYPKIEVVEASLVDSGSIITAGGVSLCIDATLYLLQRLFNVRIAAETARILEYHRAWDANRLLFHHEQDDHAQRQYRSARPERA